MSMPINDAHGHSFIYLSTKMAIFL